MSDYGDFVERVYDELQDADRQERMRQDLIRAVSGMTGIPEHVLGSYDRAHTSSRALAREVGDEIRRHLQDKQDRERGPRGMCGITPWWASHRTCLLTHGHRGQHQHSDAQGSVFWSDQEGGGHPTEGGG